MYVLETSTSVRGSEMFHCGGPHFTMLNIMTLASSKVNGAQAEIEHRRRRRPHMQPP